MWLRNPISVTVRRVRNARIGRFLAVVAILLLALVLRERALRNLRTDFDEPEYYEAGLRLADAILRHDLLALTNDDWHYEHPGLTKMLYAAIWLRYPYGATSVPDLPELTDLRDLSDPVQTLVLSGRRGGAIVGLLAVALVAAVSLPAGLLLAVHTYAIAYTSQLYLEPMPFLMSAVCVLAYIRALKERAAGRSAAGWWALSAVALGLTAAGKYIYCVAGLAVIADYCLRPVAERRPRGLLTLLGWGALSLVIFYLANFQLWLDPIGRLAASLRFHVAYPDSAIVRNADFPWYQPLVWLTQPLPALLNPGVFLWRPDRAITLLGIAGSWPMWRAWDGRGRVIVLWLLIGLAILLAWTTKWPQYIMIIIVPLCFCAGEALLALGRRAWAIAR